MRKKTYFRDKLLCAHIHIHIQYIANKWMRTRRRSRFWNVLERDLRHTRTHAHTHAGDCHGLRATTDRSYGPDKMPPCKWVSVNNETNYIIVAWWMGSVARLPLIAIGHSCFMSNHQHSFATAAATAVKLFIRSHSMQIRSNEYFNIWYGPLSWCWPDSRVTSDVSNKFIGNKTSFWL